MTLRSVSEFTNNVPQAVLLENVIEQLEEKRLPGVWPKATMRTTAPVGTAPGRSGPGLVRQNDVVLWAA